MANFTVTLKPGALSIATGESVVLTATVIPPATAVDGLGYFATWYAKGLGEFRPYAKEPFEVFIDNGGNQLAATQHTGQSLKIVWDASKGPVPEGLHPITVWVYKRTAATQKLKPFFQGFMGPNGKPLTPDGRAKGSVDVVRTPAEPLRVAMRRADVPQTSDQALWTVIRNSANALSFRNYSDFMDLVLCGETWTGEQARLTEIQKAKKSVSGRLKLPFPDVDAYRQLKVAPEVFMMLNCGVPCLGRLSGPDLEEAG